MDYLNKNRFLHQNYIGFHNLAKNRFFLFGISVIYLERTPLLVDNEESPVLLSYKNRFYKKELVL